MQRQSRRRGAAPALWLLIAVFAVPTLAQAQLFPNAAIKRKRVPCCEEPGVYRMYREQYYGYYPTCWRRFPPGWGCPSPDAPPPWDVVQRDNPVRLERDVDVPTLDAELPEGGATGFPAGDLPLPDQPSPFETTEPDGASNLNLPDMGAPGLDAPGFEVPEPPSGDVSPFDQNIQPPSAPGPEASNGVELPFLEAPGTDPISPPILPLPTSTVTPNQPVPDHVGFIEPMPRATPEVEGAYRAPRRGIVAGVLNRIGIRRR